MNFIPLNPVPPEGRNPPKNPSELLVNLDLIFSIEKMMWFPNAGEEPVEGSRLFAFERGGYRIEVQETRNDILKFILSRSCYLQQSSAQPQNESTEIRP